MFASLDQQEPTPEQEEPVTTNEILDKINQNPYIQREMGKLDKGAEVNVDLAEEILGILRDIENPLYDSADGHKYINWETIPMSYNILRRAGQSEPCRLIKNKRRLDCIQWGKSPSNEGVGRGAKLVFEQEDYQPTKEEKLILREWESKIFSKIFYPANSQYPNFGNFIGNAYEDFFDLDDITMEIRQDGFGRPVALHLQDPIIYKPVVKPRKFDMHPLYRDDITDLMNDYEKLLQELPPVKDEAEDPDYLLVYNNYKYAGVTRDRVRKHHFFLTSDFRKAQKGLSIVEQGVRMITHIVNAITMNASNFSNNRLPAGFFAFTGGGVNAMQLEKLKKILYAYQSGANNYNRFPMISLTGEKTDAKWIGARGTSKDLEYHQFMTLLFSIFCQLSGTDPRELTLGAYSDAVGKSSLFGESTDGVVKESKDVGARTFLYHLADCLNTPSKAGVNIFKAITGLDIKLRFTGFEVEDKKLKSDLITKELQSTKSINDLLAERDEEKEELLLGSVNIYDIKGFQNPQIYQSVLFNAQQQAQQAQQQQQAPPEAEQQGGQEEGQPEGLTDKDRALMEKYQGQASIDENLKKEME